MNNDYFCSKCKHFVPLGYWLWKGEGGIPSWKGPGCAVSNRCMSTNPTENVQEWCIYKDNPYKMKLLMEEESLS